jgi:hypothetical protein
MVAMKFISKKIFILVSVLVFVCSGMGVYASWIYMEGSASEGKGNPLIYIEEFEWKPEEVLPDEPEADEKLTSHLDLVKEIVSGSGIGLNTSNSYLNQEIARRKKGTWLFVPKRDTLGSMAVRQDEKLNDQFKLDQRSMSFLIYFPNYNDTEYYIYTWDKSVQTAVDGTVIPVYRTVVKKVNGRWDDVNWTCMKGYATAAYYEESRNDADYSKLLSIEPDSWQSGEPH